MEIKTSQAPAAECGAHISKLIREANSDSVVLLSGGSALNVFKYITLPQTTECRTIFMMVDERVSGEGEVNNFLQLSSRFIGDPKLPNVLNTSALEKETPSNFANRIIKDFQEKILELHQPKILTLLGVGTDGHTAGIFPLDEEMFTNTYRADSTYVPVQVEGLTIDSRASFTPNWILTSSDKLIGFIAGENKKKILNELIHETKSVFKQPAQILKLHKHSVVFTDIEIESQ